MVERCAWDSRYLQRLKRENDGTVKKHKECREAWIRACCHGGNFVCTKDSYICSLHFIGKFGPTKENPDPIMASTSAEKVSVGDLLKMRYFTTLHKFTMYICFTLFALLFHRLRG